jgi:hypothetical protein
MALLDPNIVVKVPPREEFLAVVRALAKRHANEDHAREAARMQRENPVADHET